MPDGAHEGGGGKSRGTSYDGLSRWYALLANRSEKPFRDLGLRNLALCPEESVLEIGCGTGHALAALAQVTGRAFGLDLSWGMLTATRQRFKREGISGNANMVQGDAVQLPFPNDVFDAAFMSFALELFAPDEIQSVLSECQRVLRPAGRIAIVALAKRREDNLITRLYERAHARWPKVIDCRPIRLSEEVMTARFDLQTVLSTSMWGLPVDVVVAAART